MPKKQAHSASPQRLAPFAMRLKKLRSWIKRNPKQTLKYGGTILAAIIVLVQLIFWQDRLPVFASIDGQTLGSMTVQQANRKLNEAYRRATIDLYIKLATESFATVQAADIGARVDNLSRAQAKAVPWWLRLVPTSVLWAGISGGNSSAAVTYDEKMIEQFMTKTFGEQCRIEPKNATLKVEGERLEIVKSADGGTCQRQAVKMAIGRIQPRIDTPTRVELPVEPIKPRITEDQAERLKQTIEVRLNKKIILKSGDKIVEITPDRFRRWLSFDSSGDTLNAVVTPEKADGFLNERVAKLVNVPAGISKVTTHDFIETARQNGAKGRTLDLAATRQSLADYVSGQVEVAEAKIKVIEPRIEYTRTYSGTDEGLSALIKHYTEGKKGRFGIALIELSNKRRKASYNGDMQFTSASTYKALLAFSILKRVENGQLSWGDAVHGGRNLDKCFDDMIVKSDNNCPLTMFGRIGAQNIQSDMKELGLNETNFLNPDSFKMTASDLVKYAAMLESRQLPISRASQDKLLAAMRRNMYRQGIPAGASGPVADKVGFIDAYLHDYGLVYAPNGTYALAILTENSSWADIAELTRKIEELRQK